MASNYGPHFGVRRLDEDMAIREGRFKTPVAGDALLLGTAVEVDFAAPGFLKQAVDGRALEPGVAGILIYEDQFLHKGSGAGSIDATGRVDTSDLAFAGKGRYAVLTTGAGIKCWFKNVAERTGPDGFVYPAIEPVEGLDTGDVDPGDFLGWNGTQWSVQRADNATAFTAADAWWRVLTVNDGAASCEAVLLR